jgi:hypothetical protein
VPARCLRATPHTRRRRIGALALLGLPLFSACIAGSTTVPPDEPWEGTWRLVRVNGQPLPFRRDSLEVTSEDVRFIYTGSGFARDYLRVFASPTATAGAARNCQVWFTFVVSGASISTVTSATQLPAGTCPAASGTRTFVLDGDTLRSQGGPAFTLGAVSRAYVRD